MKQIKDIVKAVQDVDFYREQFSDFAPEKNILFISPQLSGKQLYKVFLPFCGMYNTTNFTAITSIEKYNPREQLTDVNLVINSAREILWADFVVIPFTTVSLTSGDNDLYDTIRGINDSCKIVFSIDFNFYELSEHHPYKDIFTQKAIERVEDNIWNADICLVSNMAFRKYLLDKLMKLKDARLRGTHTNVGIACMPFFIDTEILLANVDYDIQEPQSVGNKVKHEQSTEEQLNKISKVAQKNTKPKDSKAANKQFRVLKEDGEWAVKKGNYKKPLMIFKKKDEAVKYVETNVEEGFDIIIYKADGTIHKSIIAEHQKSDKDGK